MYKWVFVILVIVGLGLYFSGALWVINSEESVSVTVDKDKAKELGESIKDKIEE